MMVPSGMGIVRAKVTLLSADRSRTESLELVVETGSLLTRIPEEIPVRLGTPPTRSRRFRTIDGSVIERRVGDCRIMCEGEESYAPVVFGLPGDASVLGVTALEVLGLEVDPHNQTLKRVDAFLAYATA
jgi:aspartyl protease family protein